MDFEIRPTGTGGKVLPETDPNKRLLAEHVGFVVLQAAQLDATLAGLVDLANGYDSELKLEAWGWSGAALVERLRGIEKAMLETAGFADRYERLYQVRNQVVHATRPEAHPNTDPNTTLLLLRQNMKKPAPGIYQGLVLGVPELTDLWYEMRDLNHEAWRVFIDYFLESKYAVKWGPSEQSPEQ